MKMILVIDIYHGVFDIENECLAFMFPLQGHSKEFHESTAYRENRFQCIFNYVTPF